MDLQGIGLTKNEIKAYEVLLRLGKAKAMHISKESGVPYGRIYSVLGSLETKGFVRLIPEKTKLFVPESPEKMHNIILKKKQELNEFESKIKEYKIIYEEHEKEAVKVVKGKKEFYDLLRNRAKPKTFEHSIKYTFELNPEFIRDGKELKRRKIDNRILGPVNKETEKNIKKWEKMFPDNPIVPIKNEGIAISLNDSELIVAMIKSNTTMSITDKAFIYLMKTLIESYYETHKAK